MQNIQNIFICLVLVSFSLLISHKEYKKNNKIINVISIFSIGFVMPFAISFLKLSKLSSEYDIRTIVLVVGSFLSFYYGVKCSEKWDIGKILFGNSIKKSSKILDDNKYNAKKIKNENVVRFKDNNSGGNNRISSSKKNRLNKYKININDYLVNIYNIVLDNFNTRNVILGIFVVSFVSFLIEVAVLKFIPLFSFGTPHAYSTFHIFGIHYITTLYFLMPALAILNINEITIINGRARKLTPTKLNGRAHTVRPYEKVAHTVCPYEKGAHTVRPYGVGVSLTKSHSRERARLSNVGVSSTKSHNRDQARLSNVGVSSRARSKKMVKHNVWANFVSPKVLLVFSVVYAVVMSLMLVSRALLIMTVVMAGLAYVMRARKLTPTINMRAHTVRPYGAVVAIICFIGLYLSITILRSHSVSYLNDIFEMKENTPIFITQPYMYLTQGFENLNYLVTHNERFTFGRRTLAPLFSLLRTKKYFPLVTEAPFYQIKLELTSKPIIYDLYYDFSFIGTFIIMFIIGALAKKIEIKNYKEKNIYYNLFFCMICYYLLFSFFQSYLSLLDTWFYLIFIYLLYIISKFTKTKK